MHRSDTLYGWHLFLRNYHINAQWSFIKLRVVVGLGRLRGYKLLVTTHIRKRKHHEMSNAPDTTCTAADCWVETSVRNGSGQLDSPGPGSLKWETKWMNCITVWTLSPSFLILVLVLGSGVCLSWNRGEVQSGSYQSIPGLFELKSISVNQGCHD